MYPTIKSIRQCINLSHNPPFNLISDDYQIAKAPPPEAGLKPSCETEDLVEIQFCKLRVVFRLRMLHVCLVHVM